ncbi:MAG: DUF3352 domain-containing protein [Planctomycetota bacterium]|jgi:hypothetical protein
MFRRLGLIVSLALLCLVSQTVVAAGKLPAPSKWVPGDALVVLELYQPEAVLEVLLDPKVAAAVTSSPAYQNWASQPDFQELMNLIRYLETALGTDWKTGLGRLVGGGVTLAALPEDASLLMVDAEDGQMLARLHEILLGFARGDAATQGHPERVTSRHYRGVTEWSFDGKEAHAIVANRLLMPNQSDALKAALDLRAGQGGRSLASLPGYQAARRAVGVDAAAMVFVNLEILKQHPPVAKALTHSANPLAALLLAGEQEALSRSSWLAMRVDIEEGKLTVKAIADGRTAGPAGPAAFAHAGRPDDGVVPNLSVPRRIAAFSFRRDLHAFYAAKDDLFPARTSGLIFFENMMGIFFTGRDLTDEVMAEIEPEIRVVVAEQEYDPAIGSPEVKIPAFAAILRLRNPEKFGEIAEEAWQKAVGLANFTRGQQALPGLIIDRPSHAGTKFTVAYFSSAAEGDRRALDSRFNYRPALARYGDYLILSSTDGLVRDLIDALKTEGTAAVRPLAQVHTLVEMDAVRLACVLGANRENMVRQNMIEKGSTREEAEAEADLLVTVLKHLGEAELRVGTADGRLYADLQLKPNLPDDSHAQAPRLSHGYATRRAATSRER